MANTVYIYIYAYSDAIFLDKEIEKIYADFTRLGYSRRFIDKAKISAKKGRNHEIRVKAREASARTPRTRQPFTLVIPYHKQTERLKYVYVERGIDVIYSNRDSIGSRVKRREHTHTDTGVYVLRCSEPACNEVYVGESGNIPKRLDEHHGT